MKKGIKKKSTSWPNFEGYQEQVKKCAVGNHNLSYLTMVISLNDSIKVEWCECCGTIFQNGKQAQKPSMAAYSSWQHYLKVTH